MIIGFDGSRAFVKNRTGTENYSYQLLRHLAEIDHTNQYIVYLRPQSGKLRIANRESAAEMSDSKNPAYAISDKQYADIDWPANFEFKLLNYPRLWTQFGLAKQTFVDKLDVLFVPSHTLPLIRKPGLKTVMTVHDLGAEYLPGMHQLKQRLYLSLMTKIQLKTATKLIAVSNATKNDLVNKIGVAEKQVEVVYEGLNELEEEKSNSIKMLKDLEKKTKDTEKQYQSIEKIIKLYQSNYFLFVGTIQPRKNLQRLIKAYAGFLNVLNSTPHLPHYPYPPPLILAGGKGWLAEDIYQLPKRLGIENQIIFTGRVSDQELSLLYDNAFAFTFPSLFEGFGLPVLEAFAAGIPVISSNNSSLPEVAGDAAILVNPYKTEEIMEAMLKLYTDKSLQKELVKKGSEQLKKFSWQKCAEETLKILSELAG